MPVYAIDNLCLGETKDIGSCPVIGGSGMLGFDIVRQLRAAGSPVGVLDLQPLPGEAPGVQARIGDVRTPRKVCEEANVQGTSYPLAYWLAAAAEIVAPRSNFNRFAVVQTCVDHTFVHGKAEREPGYRPIVSRETAFERSLAWLRNGAFAR